MVRITMNGMFATGCLVLGKWTNNATSLSNTEVSWDGIYTLKQFVQRMILAMHTTLVPVLVLEKHFTCALTMGAVKLFTYTPVYLEYSTPV